MPEIDLKEIIGPISTIDSLRINDKISEAINVHNVKGDIKFLPTILNSYKISDVEFTNKLPDMKGYINPYINYAIDNIVKDPSILARESLPVNFSSKNSKGKKTIKRIKTILSAAIPPKLWQKLGINLGNLDTEEPIIRKVSIKTTLSTYHHGNQGAFRVYELYLDDYSKKKMVLIVFLLDIYHLVIPSRMGKNTSDQVKHETYWKYKDYDKDIKDYYKSCFEELKSQGYFIKIT